MHIFTYFQVTIDGGKEVELTSDWDYSSLLYNANIDGNDIIFQVINQSRIHVSNFI